MGEVYDVMIIGSGPGGLSAAIYSGRYARKTLVIGGSPGGIATKAGFIENWPGTKKINGFELMNNFREHASEYGVEFRDVNVLGISRENKNFVLDVGEEKIIGRTIILAIGIHTRNLGIPGEAKLKGKGVSYCATCDGMFFRGKEVVIIGGADSACKAAVYLGEICKKVTIIYRGEQLRGEPIYLKKINDNQKIEVISNNYPLEIKGENKVESVVIKDKEDRIYEVKTDGVFVEIGAVPRTELLEGLGVEVDSRGYIKVGREMKTNVEGIYAVGDVTNSPLRQILTAASEGAVAANQAHEFLNRQG